MPYDETMDARRPHCPALIICENALADGLVHVEGPAEESLVTSTSKGQALLDSKC